MALWVDKYRPAALDKLSFHPDLSQRLIQLANADDFPHLLFYGPPGAGKKTRVVATLKELYGKSVEKLKIDQREFETPSGKKLVINIINSNFHIEVNPSDVGMYDRVVIQDLIKEVAQTQQIDLTAPKHFKVVVINEAESLTKDAQHALRRTMEKYAGNLRIILCATSSSRILAPIRSRCLLVRVAAPTHQEISDVLHRIAKKEGFIVPPEYAMRIAQKCDRNLRRAILMLEASRVLHNKLEADSPIQIAEWEVAIEDVAAGLIREQTPQKLMEVRQRFYELIAHCIPPLIIIKTLTFELLRKCDAQLKSEIIQQAAEYEHRLQLGNKPIFHLEAFAAKFMSIYKHFLLNLYED